MGATQAEKATTPRQRMMMLERSMTRVRWFGVALGLYQVLTYVPNPGGVEPPSVRPFALTAIAGLVAMNLVLMVALKRPISDRRLATLGHSAFVCDMAVVWALVWTYNFEEFGTTWVILTVLCLEGALRYQMRGAMAPVALAIVIEPLRELFRTVAFPNFQEQVLMSHLSSITFRVGIMAMIAGVAGAMARNLERERVEAEHRAELLSQLAEREADARRESNAFQQVILAGVSAQGVNEALQRMIEHISLDLGYQKLAVLTDDGKGQLAVAAAYGYPDSIWSVTSSVHESIAGRVTTTGTAAIIPDVRVDPLYLCIDDATRSQITVPIRGGKTLIGALNVESDRLDDFSDADLSKLERLSDQMALVIQNARLLSQERRTVERMKQLDTMKSDFVAIASHELRTPLTAMQGSIKTLRRTDKRLSTDQLVEMLEILDRQTDRLVRLVEDLLVVSQIDAAGFSLRMAPLRVEQLIEGLLETIGRNAGRVSAALAPEIPEVITDGGRLEQILRNLVENALKFAPPGSAVRVSLHFDKGWLVMEVADDGPGIPPEDVPNIFDRFYQVGGSMRRRSDGFGLGLYITKRLVEALGGTITVESTVGRGTSFLVRLPVATADAAGSEIA